MKGYCITCACSKFCRKREGIINGCCDEYEPKESESKGNEGKDREDKVPDYAR